MQIVAFDTETALMSRGNLAPPLTCLQVADGEQALVIHHTEARAALEWLLSPGLILVGHNVAYDVAVLMAEYPDTIPAWFTKYSAGEIFCTMIAQKLLDIASGQYATQRKRKDGYSLATTADRYGMTKRGNDPWRLRYGELRDVPVSAWPSEALDYARHDAEVTLAVYQAQVQSGGQFLDDLAHQCRAALGLRLSECVGFYTDREAVDKLRAGLNAKIDSVTAQLQAAGLVRPNGTRDLKAARAYMERVYPQVKRTKTGEISLDEDTCTQSGDETMVAYALYAGQKSLRTRVADLEQGYDLPLHTSYDSLIETGRTSSRKPGLVPGIQCQNVPRLAGYRECIVARPGHAFVACDYSGAELVTLAQTCLDWFGRSELADQLNRGDDAHLRMAARLMGETYEALVPRKKEQVVKETRQRGKSVGFGAPGGLGAATMVTYARANYGVVMTEKEARDTLDAWKEEYPTMLLYFARINKFLSGRSTCSIQQIRSPRIRGNVGYCQACNSPFQGLAADLAKDAIWQVTRKMYTDPNSHLFGSRLMFFIHDELVIEVELAKVHDAAIELSNIMIEAARRWCPDVKMKTEYAAMIHWSKSATPAYKNDRLVPFDLDVTTR
jgi:DNA polymerase I